MKCLSHGSFEINKATVALMFGVLFVFTKYKRKAPRKLRQVTNWISYFFRRHIQVL